MKKSIAAFGLLITIATILTCLIVSMLQYTGHHKCTDPTHQTCDGNCSCDGLECGPYIIHPKHCMCEFCIEATDSGSRDYIIKESKDSIFTYNEDNKLIDGYNIHNNIDSL